MTILAGYRYLCKCIDLVSSMLHNILIYRLLYSVIRFVSIITSRKRNHQAFSMTNVWLECDVSDRKCKSKYRSRPFIIPAIYVSFETRGVLGKGWFDFSPLSLENNGQSQDYCSLNFPEGWRVLPLARILE